MAPLYAVWFPLFAIDGRARSIGGRDRQDAPGESQEKRVLTVVFRHDSLPQYDEAVVHSNGELPAYSHQSHFTSVNDVNLYCV